MPETKYRMSEELACPSEEQKLSWLRSNLPVIVQPVHDCQNGFDFLCAFVEFIPKADAWTAELRLVYRGEGSYSRQDKKVLNPVGSWLYRSFNYLSFGRTCDINQIAFEGIRFDPKKDELPWKCVSTVDWNGPQEWSKGTKKDVLLHYSLVHHYHLEAEFDGWEKQENSRPILFINTGNHLHGPEDANPELKKVRFERYPVFEGDPDDAEDFGKVLVPHRCNMLTCCRWRGCCCLGHLRRHHHIKLALEDFKELAVWPDTPFAIFN